MPTFKYKALHDDKTSYEATVEAKDRFEVYDLIRKDGGQVIKVELVAKRGGRLSLNPLSFFQHVKELDVILLTRNLGAMLQAGLSLSRALDVIQRQSRKAKLKEVVTGINADIQQGGSLSSGMLKYPHTFSKLVTSMVQAGEESGTLAETLRTIASQLEQSYELKKRVKGAMIYPSVIVSVLLVVGALMMIFIVPTLTATFRTMDIELPITTRVIIMISDFLIAHTLAALLIVAASIGGCMVAMRTYGGRYAFEAAFLRIPVIGLLMKETNSARTGRTLSSLLASGVNMLTSIEITRDVIQNNHFKKVLDQAHETVQKGQPFAQVFMDAEILYPPLVGELIAVGEETGELPGMLKEIAEYYEREVNQKTKNMSTIIEPILMLVVGVAVGFFAVAMISPIYGVMGSIN